MNTFGILDTFGYIWIHLDTSEDIWNYGYIGIHLDTSENIWIHFTQKIIYFSFLLPNIITNKMKETALKKTYNIRDVCFFSTHISHWNLALPHFPL